MTRGGYGIGGLVLTRRISSEHVFTQEARHNSGGLHAARSARNTLLCRIETQQPSAYTTDSRLIQHLPYNAAIFCFISWGLERRAA